ncbi:hypothetical protein AN402_3206 [Bacillus wiedmannii]|nr:hypothetical protein AN402_3206 [Bacillus wiedmannii]
MEEKVVGYVRVSTEGQVRERDCKENELQLLHISEDKGLVVNRFMSQRIIGKSL